MKTYTKNNINLDIYSTQRVESLHSKIKSVKNYIMSVDKFYYNISKLIEEYHNYKSYQYFQSINIVSSDINISLNLIKTIYSHFVFKTFIIPEFKAMINNYIQIKPIINSELKQFMVIFYSEPQTIIRYNIYISDNIESTYQYLRSLQIRILY